MALTTVVRPETAPHFFEFPSMIQASISTVPLLVKTDPFPALKFGWFSNSRTCSIHYIYIYIYIYRERERGKLTDRNEEFEQSILRKAKQIESIELPVY
jgi:hypothetical protein